MCGRNQNGGKVNINLNGSELTRSFIEQSIPKSFIKQLQRIRMCGNFGDPAAASEAISICESFRISNPSIHLSFHTNGGLRNPEWWFKLGRLFRGDADEIYFALDGLEDTLSIYRRGVDYKKVISNALAAIRAGARVHWVMLVFEHNEHQIDDARKLAKELGFFSFRLKATKRFLKYEDNALELQYPVKNEAHEILYSIKPPTDNSYVNPVITHYDQPYKDEIACHVLERKSLFISAKGEVFPCCWIGAAIYPAHKTGPIGQIAEILNKYGGVRDLSLKEHSLHEIINGDFFRELPGLWKSCNPEVCLKNCNPNKNGFKAQFIERTDYHFLSPGI